MESWACLSKRPWIIYCLDFRFSNRTPTKRLYKCMYVSSARCWIFCVPCGHITNNIIVPSGCYYIHKFCTRKVSFHPFNTGRTSLRMEIKDQSCCEGLPECGGHCKVYTASSYIVVLCVPFGRPSSKWHSLKDVGIWWGMCCAFSMQRSTPRIGP